MTSRGLMEKPKTEGMLDVPEVQSLSSRHNISIKDTTLATRCQSHLLLLDFYSIQVIQTPRRLTGMMQAEHADVHNSKRQSPLV